MSSEIPGSSPENTKDPYAAVDRLTEETIDELIKEYGRSNPNNPAWIRADLLVAEKIELFDQLKATRLSRLLPNAGSELPLIISEYHGMVQDPIIVSSYPELIAINIADIDHSRTGIEGWDYNEKHIKITLMYGSNMYDDNSALVSLVLNKGEHHVYTTLYMARYGETGYEGHGKNLSVKLKPREIESFINLINQTKKSPWA